MTTYHSAVSDVVASTTDPWMRQGKWIPFYDMYIDLHKHPGRSNEEYHAVSRVVSFLKQVKLGLEENGFAGTFDVFEGIGALPNRRSPGGIVAVMKNIDGKGEGAEDLASSHQTVLVRADMDGLRVTEETGVSYSSIVPGMMHACGHDMHTTALMATTQMMVESRQHWRGTFIALFQPAEETLSGARDMIKDGLYDLIPEPSAILAAHITPEPAGTLSLTPNIAFSRSDRFEIRIHGRGGHASRPESCIDPIVCSAYCITRIQSIVSRVVPSTSAGVITIGKIHGGETGNVIPDFVDMEVSIRSNSDGLAELMERELRRIVASEVCVSMREDDCGGIAWSVAAQEVDDANPRIWHTLHGPLLCNDDVLLRSIAPVFTQIFGARFNANVPPVSGSEDIAYLTRAKDGRVIPLLYWRYGGSSLEVIQEVGGDPARLPSNHSSKFLPQLRMEEMEDPLKVGARALFAAALVLSGKM